MFLSFLLLPLLIIIIICLFSRLIGIKGVYWLIIIMMLELIILSIILNYEILLNNQIITLNLNIKYGLFINWYLLFDHITSIMLFMILTISFLVLIYTYDYMINDAHMIRFNLYIIIFIFFMLLLITNNNLIILFIGWEGIGLSSYLLISFWFTRLYTSLGSLMALFMNRIGDIFYIISILIGMIIYGSSDILIITNNLKINNDLFLLFFFLAATAKSAQLYLHFWLPYSMEGPTPISALIHAATMVTAGVYILIRVGLLINYSYYIIFFISIIGCLTCFFGSLLALTSLDMKELIAYSTMSQLGYMITCIGIKLVNLSFFHLIFHAYFKALLFLTVGSILHTILDIQDLRYTGSLLIFIPITYIFLLFGFISLIGLPFTTGFYSKESIIMMSYNNITNNIFISYLSHFIFILTFLTAFITILYTYKFIYNLFIKTTSGSLFIFKHLHFFSLHLTLAISLLALISLFIGFLFFKWNLLINLYIPFVNHNIPLIIKFITLIFFILAYLLLNLIFNYNISSYILNIQFGFKYLYLFISGLFIHLSYRILFKLFDYGFFDLLFPITSINLYSFSNKLTFIINYQYLLSFILFSFYIILYLF